MSKFGDKLGKAKPRSNTQDNWKEVSIGILCSCGADSEKVWYDKSSKKVKLLCDAGHEEILNMELPWLTP